MARNNKQPSTMEEVNVQANGANLAVVTDDPNNDLTNKGDSTMAKNKQNNELEAVTTETYKKIDGAFDTTRQPRQSRKAAIHVNAPVVASEAPKSNYQQLVGNDEYVEAFLAYARRDPSAVAGEKKEYAHAPYHTVTVYGHSIRIYDSLKKVVINDQDTTGYAIELNKHYDSKCALNLLDKLYENEVTHHFEKIEVGFVTYTKPMSKIESKFAGRISRMYRGDNPQLLKCRPERGVNILGQRDGNFYVQKEIPEVPFAKGDVTFEDIEADIIHFKEQRVLDALLLGQRVEITPFLMKKAYDEEGHAILRTDGSGKQKLQYAPERVVAFVNARVGDLSLTPGEAARNGGAKIAAVVMNKETDRVVKLEKAMINKMPVAAQEEVAQTLENTKVKVDNVDYLLSDLFGTWVRIMDGGFVYRERQYVAPTTALKVLEAVREGKSLYHIA